MNPSQSSPFGPTSPFTLGNSVPPTPDLPPSNLQSTLLRYYGFSTFRPGQVSVISSILQNRDCAVFWATGSGKSLCYQLPPLLTQKPAIIISPLISLMQDQCNKLNGSLSDDLNDHRQIATYLGSGQTDPLAESKALNGDYLLVYLTPEKLLHNNCSFLDQLSKRLNPSLIAIDEAHCVSEWGHDFRPEYRQIGQALRSHPHLQTVPCLALTATASPKVQQDVVDNLQLKNPAVSVQSFDRDNLEITIKRKQTGGYVKALSSLLQTIATNKESTILYVPTKALVGDLTNWIRNSYKELNPCSYHAGMSLAERNASHTQFLTGKSCLIVATIAFGMGIDKPDTRNVIHYGAPKTMEEYYQQIGRAGRDGLKSRCVMFVNEADFDRYGSEFYVGSLSRGARESVRMSTETLRKFCADLETCRRKQLLLYFGERGRFGDWCGTCDVCQSRKQGGEVERDFGRDGARLILMAVTALKGPSMSVLEKVMGESVVEGYRYNFGRNPEEVRNEISREREEMREIKKKKRPISFFKELIPSMVQRGYVSQRSKTVKLAGGYSNSYSIYEVTSLGHSVLSDPTTPILLPIPPSIREFEAEEEQKRLAALQKLQQSGIDLNKLPKSELDSGEGEVIDTYKHWISHLETLKKTGREDRLKQMEDLKQRIDQWRYETADQLRMAPGAVLPDHLMLKVAYASSSASRSCPMEAEALHAAGVRSAGLKNLVQVLKTWIDETTAATTTNSSVPQSHRMIFPVDPFTPASKWKHAIYKPNKKTGLAAWESSYQRFSAGEHPQTIAISPINNKPIQVNTVIGHILDAVINGERVSLKRISEVSNPPTREEWEELMTAETMLGINVVEEPVVSLKEFLKFKMGEEFGEKPVHERTEEEKVMFQKWCVLAKWYLTLRRAGYEPKFEE